MKAVFKALDKCTAANKALYVALEKQFPKGSVWNVVLSSRQIRPSVMTVFDYGRGGEVRFMRERKPTFYGPRNPLYRYVPIHQIRGRVS